MCSISPTQNTVNNKKKLSFEHSYQRQFDIIWCLTVDSTENNEKVFDVSHYTIEHKTQFLLTIEPLSDVTMENKPKTKKIISFISGEFSSICCWTQRIVYCQNTGLSENCFPQIIFDNITTCYIIFLRATLIFNLCAFYLYNFFFGEF